MSVALIIRISRIEAEAIPAAVKIAAALLSREHIPETEAPKAAQITVRKWDKIRHHMSDIFSFTGGRITLLRGENLDAFDLAALRSDWQAAKTASQGKYPTDPRILDVIDLGIEPKQATSLAKFIVKTYGESHLLRAIKVAKEKTPPPLDPKAFLMSVVKGSIGGLHGGVTIPGMRAKRVKRFVRITNPEAARTELLGWEAPTSVENNIAVFPEGQRRQVYRTRSGSIQVVAARANTTIPGVDVDPGVIIED